MDIYKIKNSYSRASFECVLQAYYAKNYKACVILLYDLIVNDLYKKMISMNAYSLMKLGKEIQQIENLQEQKNNNKYSDIEKKIYDTYKDRHILGDSTLFFLEYLKKARDMCAHPFIFGEEDYMPESELVFAFITKSYNDILTIGAFIKRPYEIINKEINDYIYPKLNSGIMFVFDERFVEDEVKKTKKLLSRYFSDFVDENLKKLFSTTLDLIISKRSDEIQKKQYANFLVLNALLDYINETGKNSIIENYYDWGKLRIESIRDEQSSTLAEDWMAQTYLYRIIIRKSSILKEIESKNHDLFELLETSLYNNAGYFVSYWTIFESDINKALKKFNGDESCESYREILEKLHTKIDTDNLLGIFKSMFMSIPSFNGYNLATKCLDTFLSIVKEDPERFSQEKLNTMFEIFNDNRQIYDMLEGSRLEQLTELGYDLSSYNNIKQKGSDNI